LPLPSRTNSLPVTLSIHQKTSVLIRVLSAGCRSSRTEARRATPGTIQAVSISLPDWRRSQSVSGNWALESRLEKQTSRQLPGELSNLLLDIHLSNIFTLLCSIEVNRGQRSEDDLTGKRISVRMYWFAARTDRSEMQSWLRSDRRGRVGISCIAACMPEAVIHGVRVKGCQADKSFTLIDAVIALKRSNSSDVTPLSRCETPTQNSTLNSWVDSVEWVGLFVVVSWVLCECLVAWHLSINSHVNIQRRLNW